MLTIEMLRQNAVLAALPETTLASIAEMSKNDENTVIGNKIGALHGQYDADILSISGIAKQQGEKSYDYAKRVLGSYETKVKAAKATEAELKAAKEQVTSLQAKIEANAGDETLRKQLNDAKTQVTQLQQQLTAKTTELTNKQAEFDKTIKDTHVDYAFKAATTGLKFKDSIPSNVRDILLASAKTEVLAKGTPDFIEDGKGGKVLVLRDANGNILNNPANNLNPYTIGELVMQTSIKDVLDDGRRQTGGGTGSGSGNGGNSGSSVDLSAARTQVEADRLIETHLLSTGLTRDSSEFASQAMQLRAENKVSELPIR